MDVKLCSACTSPVGEGARELRAESGDKLVLIGYSCGCLNAGRLASEWEEIAAGRDLKLSDMV